jgi:hypothetical protein
MTKLARASVSGAVAFAAAQVVDMRVTGRQGSATPVLGFEALTRRRVPDGVPRVFVGYAVQSALAPMAALAASRTSQRVLPRFGAAVMAPLVWAGIVNPALGVSSWPGHWTRDDWTRELTLKSVLAVAVLAAL